MACFLVPVAESVVVKAVEKHVEKKEENILQETNSGDSAVKLPLSVKLKWLTRMLWGGSILLAFEHLWHGEIVPYFPFLTAMNDPNDAMEMFHEMLTVGVGMAVLMTVIWFGVCFAADRIVNREVKAV